MSGEGGRTRRRRRCSSSTTSASLRLLCRVNLELDGHRVLRGGDARRGARAARGGSVRTSILLDVHLGPERRARAARRHRGRSSCRPASCCSRARARSRRSCAPGSRACSASRSSSAELAAAVVGPDTSGRLDARERHHRPHARRVRGAPRALPLRALRGGARGPRRREGDLRAGRDRRALPRPLLAGAARRAARGRGVGRRRRARAPLPAAQDVRGRDRRRRARRARGRAREPDPRRPRRRGEGEELPLRSAQAKLAVLPGYRDRDELGALANAESARFNDDRRELLAAGEALEAELSGEPDAIARNARREGHLAARARARARRGAAGASADAYDAPARALVREAARPGARGRPDLEPHELPPPALAARADVHEGARGRGLRRDARARSASTSSRSPGSGSTSTTARRSRRARA